MIRLSDTIGEWVGERIGFVPYPHHGLEIVSKGVVVGGIIYWSFEYEQEILCGVEVSFALDNPHSLSRKVLDIGTRYPFEGLGTERLCARINESNIRSQRITRAVGMKPEGIIRRGRFEDQVLFGMTRSDWNEWTVFKP